MSDSSFAATVIGLISTYLVVVIALYVLLIIAQWKIFTKAGEAGWKSLIPIYNLYIMFKITWKSMFFWIMLGCGVAAAIFANFDSSAMSYISTIFSVAASVLPLIMTYKLSKSFGHGVGFFIGLLLLPNIFHLILGFGKSQYLGAQA